MRWIVYSILSLMISITASGQGTQTLISGDIDHGGYGAFLVKPTSIHGSAGVLTGGRGAWIIDHTIYLGGGGIGLASDVNTAPDSLLDFGYGGIMAGYIHNSNEVVHLKGGVMFAAGSAGQHHTRFDDGEEDAVDFYVLEPEVNVQVNVTEHFRVMTGISYRLLTDFSHLGISDGDLRGFSGTLALQFGAF